MKHIVITIALLCSVATITQAQNGPMVGLTLHSNWFKTRMSPGFADPIALDNQLSYETNRRFGFGAGLKLGYRFSDRFSVGLQPTVLRKGGKITVVENGTWNFVDRAGNLVEVPNSVMSWDLQVWAVHIPLIARVKVLGNERFGLTTFGGLSFNYAFRGREEQVCIDEVRTYPVASNEKVKFGDSRFDQYASFDISIPLGIGLEFALNEDGNARLNIDAGWELGMRNMYSSARRDYIRSQGSDIVGSRKHRGFLLSAGVSYTFAQETIKG
jgi:Outer membrane protein beta-barrel domain